MYVHVHVCRCNQADPRGVVWVSRGTDNVNYLGDYRTGIGGNDRHFNNYAETENIRHFEYRVMDWCSVPMLSEWVVVTRQWP